MNKLSDRRVDRQTGIETHTCSMSAVEKELCTFWTLKSESNLYCLLHANLKHSHLRSLVPVNKHVNNTATHTSILFFYYVQLQQQTCQCTCAETIQINCTTYQTLQLNNNLTWILPGRYLTKLKHKATIWKMPNGTPQNRLQP
jgi:hypothetical protein